MKYQNLQLSGIYSLIIEGKPGAAQLGTIYNMPIPTLRQYMANLKRTDPDTFGWLAFSGCAEPQTSTKMIEALGG